MSDAILNPISEFSPCGSEYKYEDAYLALEAEIDKSNSMAEDVSTDWVKVLDDAKELLITASKDIKIACWFVYAAWKTGGASELEQALNIFNALLQRYKETLFPKSKKVKIAALVWLEDLLQGELLDEHSKLVVSLNAKNSLEILALLQTSFSLCIDENIVLFNKLRLALERTVKDAEVQAKPQAKQTPTKQVTGVEFSEINNDDDAIKVLRSLKKNATLLHNYWREKESGDLRAIRLVRMLSWLDIDSIPLHEDGKTPLHPPSQLSLDEIEEYMEKEEYSEAFNKLENLIALSPFWLEGHYLGSQVLEKMGQEKAAFEVKNALVAYVKSDEKILELTFNDTTPFASLDMKKWLALSKGGVASNSADVDENDTNERILEEAYKKAKKKQIKEAMELLQNAYVGAVNNEEKFHWRLAKAELAVKFNKNDVALALFDDLKQDIDKYSLDEWKPELAAKVFSLYLNTFNRTTADIEELNRAYTRLCKLDIVQALEIKI
ncbi:type VI secretion system protein TssA [Sulfurimonas sp.]